MLQQSRIAQDIFVSLKTVPCLGEPFLRGSLLGTEADELSDIDIGLRPVELTDIAAVERIVDMMYARHEIEFHDWARSLLPGAAVVSFFLRDVPIFWNVDFEVIVPASQRLAIRETVPHDQTAHDLKIWPLALKYSLRETDAQWPDVTRFVCRYVGSAPEDWSQLRDSLGDALRAIESDADGTHSHFISRCWDTYHERT
jgi:hypothetical protein